MLSEARFALNRKQVRFALTFLPRYVMHLLAQVVRSLFSLYPISHWHTAAVLARSVEYVVTQVCWQVRLRQGDTPGNNWRQMLIH